MTSAELPKDAIVGYSSTTRSLLQSHQLNKALQLMGDMQLRRAPRIAEKALQGPSEVDLGQFVTWLSLKAAANEASIVLTASMTQGNWLKSQALLPLGAF